MNGSSLARCAVFRSNHRARSNWLRAAPLIWPSRPPSPRGGEGLTALRLESCGSSHAHRSVALRLVRKPGDATQGWSRSANRSFSPTGEGGLEGRMRGQRNHGASASATHGTSRRDRAGPGLRCVRAQLRRSTEPAIALASSANPRTVGVVVQDLTDSRKTIARAAPVLNLVV